MKTTRLQTTLYRVVMLAFFMLATELTLFRSVVLAQTTPFLISPYYGTANITQGWSTPFEPNHHAYDFGLTYQPILAADAGTMAAVQWFSTTCHAYNGNDSNIGLACGFGLFIRLDHSNGYSTYYAHLSAAAFALTNGVTASVKAGQIIGNSGATGWTVGAAANTPGPHLHFETRNNAHTVQIDPFNPNNLWKDGQWSTPSRPIPAPVNGGETVIDDNTTNAGGFSKGSGNACTGDCGGWTRADNLYWATSNLVVPSSWAKWQPSIPNGGAIYEILVNIPAVNALPDTDAGTTWFAPYTVQYYDGTNIVTSVAYVDQRGSRGYWISIGAYYMIPGNWVQLTNASGEAVGSRRLGADSVKFIRRGTVYAPDFRYSNGWASTIYLSNNGGGTSQFVLKFFDSNGAENICTRVVSTLPAHGSISYYCPNSAIASVVVDANQDAAVVVMHQIGSGSTYATEAYPGVDHPIADVHIPIVQKNNSGTNNPNFWNSYIYVQNAGNAAANIAVEFFPVAGSGNYYIYNENNVAAGEVRRIDVSTKSIGLARADYPTVLKFIGAVHLSNPQNQPLAVAATQYQASALLDETSNTQPPATTLYAPLAQNNNAGWLSGLALRSTSGGGNFTIQYYNAGVLCFTEPAAAGNPDPRNIYPAPSAVGCPTTPSAVFQAGAPIVANVNQLLNATAATTYAAISQPALTAIVPKVFRSGGWWDGFTIMNTGNANATITVRLYDASGALNADGVTNLATINSTPLAPRKSVVVLSQIPDGFVGSALVTSSQLVAVQANSRNIANAGDNIGSYPAIHR